MISRKGSASEKENRHRFQALIRHRLQDKGDSLIGLESERESSALLIEALRFDGYVNCEPHEQRQAKAIHRNATPLVDNFQRHKRDAYDAVGNAETPGAESII